MGAGAEAGIELELLVLEDDELPDDGEL